MVRNKMASKEKKKKRKTEWCKETASTSGIFMLASDHLALWNPCSFSIVYTSQILSIDLFLNLVFINNTHLHLSFLAINYIFTHIQVLGK